MRKLTAIPLVAGGLVGIPIYLVTIVVCLVIGVLVFGNMAMIGIRFLWSIVLGAAHLVDYIGSRTLAVVAICGIVAAITRHQRRENKMLALLYADAGSRYCSFLLRTRALYAFPIPASEKLTQLYESAVEEHALGLDTDDELDDEAFPSNIEPTTPADIVRERERLCGEIVRAGVDPVQFSRFVLSKAVRGELPGRI